ncbi:MAG: cell division protein FtsL [Myxococcota bacterium]
MKTDVLWLSVGIAAPVVAAALLLVWTRVVTVQLGYELSRALQEHQALSRENAALELERTTLSTPERLRRLGTRMGLGPPRRTVRVDDPPRERDGPR